MGRWLPVIILLLAVSAGAGTFVWLKNRPVDSGWATVDDLKRLEEEAAARPNDPDAAVEVVIAYAGLLGQFGDLMKSTKGTLALGDEFPEFGQKPFFKEKKQEILAGMDKIRSKVGITSEQHYQSLLTVGIDTATKALARTDLSRPQRAAVFLSRGRLYLQKDQPKAALDDARFASAEGGDRVSVELLRGDACVDLGLWRKAIESYKAASLALSAWANAPPDWELRLLWSMRRGRSYRYERRWRERRDEVAANLRMVISDQIRILQGVEKLDLRARQSGEE